MRPPPPKKRIYAACLLFGLLFVSTVILAMPRAALYNPAERALVLYEFDLEQKDHYVVLNIFDTSDIDADMAYITGIKFLIKSDGIPIFNEFNENDKKKFVETIVDGDHSNKEKIRSIQEILGAKPIDGDWGQGTWKALISYVGQNSGETQPLPKKRYRIINILKDKFEDNEVSQLEQQVIGHEADHNELPQRIVLRAYKGWPEKKSGLALARTPAAEEAPQNSTPPTPKPPAREILQNSISKVPSDDQQNGQQQLNQTEPQKNPIPEPLDTNAVKEESLKSFSALKTVILIIIGVVCCLIFRWFVRRKGRSTDSSESKNPRAQFQNRRIEQRNSPSYNGQSEGAVIRQPVNRVGPLEHTYARNLEVTNKINGPLEDNLINSFSNIKQDLTNVSGRITKLEDSVQAISERLSKIESHFGAQLLDIICRIDKANVAIFEGLFVTGTRGGDFSPFLFDVNYQLKGIKQSLDRWSEKIDALKGTGSNELSVNYPQRKIEPKEDGIFDQNEKQLKADGISKPKRNYSEY